jgi:hypothetical protein
LVAIDASGADDPDDAVVDDLQHPDASAVVPRHADVDGPDAAVAPRVIFS